MRCAYCGDDITGKPIRQDGEVYCSRGCADQALAEEEFDELDEYGDDNEDYRDVVFEEGFELDYYDEDEPAL